VLNKSGGSMGEGGSVAWQFTRNAYFAFELGSKNEDEIFELAVEAGADDVLFDEDYVEIIAPMETFKDISDSLKAAGIKLDESELRNMPNQEIGLDPAKTIQVMNVIEDLEDLDDIQSVASNLAISDAAIAELETA